MEEDGTVSPTVKSMDFLQRVADLGFPVAEIPAYADRVGSFRDYAKAMGAGTIMAPPVLLSGRLRKLHVRNTIIEDHAMRMHLIPEAVEGKLRDLAASPFSFFRGTALLYYRDWAGTDAHLPSVASVGDVHPENFGLVPGTHGGALFTPNDFDEAWYAPFTYDVYRGATGFALAGYEMGLKRKRWLRIAETFAEGYIRGVEKCAGNPEESQRRIVADNAPKVLKPFFDKAERSREKFLDKRIDRDAQQFLEDERVARRPEFIPMIQQAINRYRNVQDTEDYFTVLDVATRTGSGTASRGLPRFWALVRGDDQPVIMELKMSRPSALEGLVPVERETTQSPAERTASAHSAFIDGGDPLFGFTDIEGMSFIVRERSPMKVNIDVAGMDEKQLRDYADICGEELARTHARADILLSDIYPEDKPIWDRIMHAVHAEVFLADVVEFADEAVERVLSDHAMFIDDVDRGAFKNLGA